MHVLVIYVVVLAINVAAVAKLNPANQAALAHTEQDNPDAGRINWAINDAPPFHVLHGEYQRQGVCDVLIKVVHRYLPELRPRYLEMPQTRISQAMDNKEPVCFPCMIYQPEAAKRAIYSQPTHLYYPHQIITNNTTAKTLRALYGEPISLDKLLDDPRFRLGYPAGRRYGVLQPLLNEHDPYLARSGPDGAVAILNMISSGRLDYTIDYPMVANYFQQLYNRNMETLIIAENQQPVAGAIGCANNAWGKQQIAAINQVMPDIRRDPEFLEVLKLWHSSNNNPANDDYDYYNEQGLKAFDAMAGKKSEN
ncbi:hypothetical protein WG68_04720 [Arsukibacterium ikkense]|uniref:ABC transporter substrate-binding protein n=2 Tax=Arsukibacterium ikkense TaxID=336831 RepID=A0A0M2V803_9GAMM|nr:hypothetical protein WG68_04720 [Arsukibacterium ikkense]